MSSNLYQTLEDRSNINEVEEKGPFICNRKDAWLGNGYYYWDTFINNAHLWGEKIYKKNNKEYIICLSKVEFNENNLYDLNSPNTLLEFQTLQKKLSEIYPDKNITVAVVLEQLKQSKEFTYKAIRVTPMNDMNDKYAERIPFKKRHKAYLSTSPHIQVCILDKNFIGNDNFKVVCPLIYSEGYAI